MRNRATRAAPGYWMHETSGVLRPAVWLFINGHPMGDAEIAAMRAYLRQWAAADAWMPGPELDALRSSVNGIRTRGDIFQWIGAAINIGMDPL